MEHSVQMADGAERVSVKHRTCCGELFRGRLTRLVRFKVAVNHGSTLVLRTTVGGDRGAKAAAEAGKRAVGILWARDQDERRVGRRCFEIAGGSEKRME